MSMSHSNVRKCSETTSSSQLVPIKSAPTPLQSIHMFGRQIDVRAVNKSLLVQHSQPNKDKTKYGKKQGNSKSKKQTTRKHTTWDGHFHALESALNIAWQEEKDKFENRRRTWPQEKFEKIGLALFDLKAKYEGWWYKDSLVLLQLKTQKKLPFHQFTKRDPVILSGGNLWRDREGSVVAVSSKWLRIALLGELEGSLHGGVYELHMNTNDTTYERCLGALRRLHRQPMGPLRRVLKGLPPKGTSIMQESCARPEWAQSEKFSQKLKHSVAWVKKNVNYLDSTQLEAIEASLQRTLTMWEGPPGTGKTLALCAYVAASIRSMPKKSKVLIIGASNAAVDNFALGLKEFNINAIRWGQPVRVHENVRSMTLAARVVESALGKEAASLREKLEKAEGGLTRGQLWKIEEMEETAKEEIMKEASAVVSTCIAAGDPDLCKVKFRVAVLDEANQATEPESLVGLLLGAENVVIAGESQELEPTASNREARDLGLYWSMHDRLKRVGMKPFVWNTQYRMHPFIAEFPSHTFYEGKMANGITEEGRPPVQGVPWPDPKKPVLFINESSVETESVKGDKGPSYTNPKQSEIALKLAKSIIQADRSLQPKDIGIMASYPAQAQHIQDQLSEAGGQLKEVVATSVEGLQGKEKEVIIFSTVRSNDDKALGFVSHPKRMNVALTRARRGLIVIGNKDTLSGNKKWRLWLSWVKKHSLETTM